MCQECGCGLRTDALGNPPASANSPSWAHAPGHPHSHDQPPATEPRGTVVTPHQVLSVQQSLLAQNDRWAERNRGYFRAKRWLVLNVVSAPGSGKTTLIQKTALALRPRARLAVIVGDLATDHDAQRLRTAGIPVVQISTGTLCHLEGDMIARAVEQLGDVELDILVIENVGNLVCPAAFDLGEHLRVVLLSAAEGEDKPLKYPPLFHSAHAALLTKLDLAEVLGFDRAGALANLRQVSHHARIFEVSARTDLGMAAWVEYLLEQREALVR